LAAAVSLGEPRSVVINKTGFFGTVFVGELNGMLCTGPYLVGVGYNTGFEGLDTGYI
jgi:hypothetical protein